MNDGASLLRNAWAVSTGNETADRLLRQSLAASAQQRPELLPVVRELELGGRTQLDLHLEGARESRHETSALALSDFLKRVSEAVQETAKSIGGVRRLVGDLSVMAPAPGSVRLVFVERDAPDQGDGASGNKPAAANPSGDIARKDLWAAGIERVAGTLTLADDDETSLDASVQELDPPAREALRMLAKAVEKNKWTIAGSLTTRAGDSSDIEFSVSAARRLADAIQFKPAKVKPVRERGTVDAWRWSSSVMRLAPAKGAAIEAHVPDAYRTIVAGFNAQPGRLVDVEFDVLERTAPRSIGKINRSYTLRSIRVAPSLFDDA